MGDMSRFEDKPRSYLLVGFIGVIGAVTAIAFYVLYLKIWNVTLNLLRYSGWFIFLFAFSALAVSFVLVRLFAESKSTESGTHIVLETHHPKNGETGLHDSLVKPLTSIFTQGLVEALAPEGSSLSVGWELASSIAMPLKVRIHYLQRYLPREL